MKTYNYPWTSDSGEGTYQNPVLHADYSDPDVIRVGNDFYMTASSFNCTPGLPILHSKDLVNWKLVNHAIQQVPHPSYQKVRPGCGVWAPSIRFHDHKFWIFFPMPDEGIYVTTATDPLGKWCEPWLLQEAKGWIDPCPFWDEDGQAYLAHAYANSRAGIRDKIHIRPMAPDGSKLLGEGRIVIYTPHHPYLEGPKVHKWNGWYYIFAPGGGVQTGWQVVFRSKNLWGPYEEKIILERGITSINGPHQGAVVELENGEWWFLHFQDVGPYGRITHLQPMSWKEEWPMIGVDYDKNGVGEPVSVFKKPTVSESVPITVPATTDEFDSPKLGLQWQWQANHESSWYSLTERKGFLRLHAQTFEEKNLSLYPAVLSQKFPAKSFVVETALDFNPGGEGESAGLVLTGGGQSASVEIVNDSQERKIRFQIREETLFIGVAPEGRIRFRVAVNEEAVARFGYASEKNCFVDFAPTFTPKEGGWIGAKVGLFSRRSADSSARGHADFDYFRWSSYPAIS